MSGFGQLNLDLTDNIKLSGGLRYTHEEKDARYSRVTERPGTITLPFPEFPERSPTRTETNVDWTFSAQYYLQDRNVLYAAASRGSKSGGFRHCRQTRTWRNLKVSAQLLSKWVPSCDQQLSYLSILPCIIRRSMTFSITPIPHWEIQSPMSKFAPEASMQASTGFRPVICGSRVGSFMPMRGYVKRSRMFRLTPASSARQNGPEILARTTTRN
ncbi:TonB-dependent receptor [Kineobactrum salinum]|uniref:TonB-dependent receptor n=1 Tax=Kineobactrum salinum TaxID=2708301 RepID=A0A6C0U1C1_9GAMM|nr:TonB-dependent receptor [Kineobactrum salinum]